MSDPVEIEITPAMVEAGEAVLCLYDPRYSDVTDYVRQIYVAMVLAHQTAPR